VLVVAYFAIRAPVPAMLEAVGLADAVHAASAGLVKNISKIVRNVKFFTYPN
jgi:hypothetical protein